MKKYQWFRFYTDWRENRKVKRLHETFQLCYIDLLCLKREGKFPCSIEDVAWYLRVTKNRAHEIIKALEAANLIEGGDIHDWDGRQYKYDISTPRVQKHRMKRSRNVPETPSETDTDTDTEEEGLRVKKGKSRKATKPQLKMLAGKATAAGASLHDFMVLRDMDRVYQITKADVDPLLADIDRFQRGTKTMANLRTELIDRLNRKGE